MSGNVILASGLKNISERKERLVIVTCLNMICFSYRRSFQGKKISSLEILAAAKRKAKCYIDTQL